MKRVSLFCGHYGSGKTNIAVNYAKLIRSHGHEVCIADLDIVNPYFRTKDSEEELAKEGIKLISLPYANSNVDLPSLPSEAYGLVQRYDRYAVFDIGGDDRGAYALGRYSPYILEENNFDMFFVANFYRPLTRTPDEAYSVMQEIQAVCSIPFTGIINNSNLGEETMAADVEKTIALAEKLGEMSCLPVCFTSIDERLQGRVKAENTLSLQLQKKQF